MVGCAVGFADGTSPTSSLIRSLIRLISDSFLFVFNCSFSPPFVAPSGFTCDRICSAAGETSGFSATGSGFGASCFSITGFGAGASSTGAGVSSTASVGSATFSSTGVSSSFTCMPAGRILSSSSSSFAGSSASSSSSSSSSPISGSGVSSSSCRLFMMSLIFSAGASSSALTTSTPSASMAPASSKLIPSSSINASASPIKPRRLKLSPLIYVRSLPTFRSSSTSYFMFASSWRTKLLNSTESAPLLSIGRHRNCTVFFSAST